MGSSSHKGKGRESDRRREDRRERPENERRRESAHSRSAASGISLCGPGLHRCGPGNPGCFQSTEEAIIKLGLEIRPRPEPDWRDRRTHSHWEREYREWRDATCPCRKGFFCRRHAQWVSGAAVETDAPRNSDQINEPVCHQLGLPNHPDDSLHTQDSITDDPQQDTHQPSTYSGSELDLDDHYDMGSGTLSSTRGIQSQRHSRARSHQPDDGMPSRGPYPDAYTDQDLHKGSPGRSRSSRDAVMGSQQGSWYHDQGLHPIEEHDMMQQASTSSGSSHSVYYSSAERYDHYPNPQHRGSALCPGEEDSQQPSTRNRGQVIQQDPYLEDDLDPTAPPYSHENQIESNDSRSTPWHNRDDQPSWGDSRPQHSRSSHHERHGRNSGSYLYDNSSNSLERETSGYNQQHSLPTESLYSDNAHVDPHLDSLVHQHDRPSDSSYPRDLGSDPYGGTFVDEALQSFSDIVITEDYRNHPSGSGSHRTKDDGKGKRKGKGKHR